MVLFRTIFVLFSHRLRWQLYPHQHVFAKLRRRRNDGANVCCHDRRVERRGGVCGIQWHHNECFVQHEPVPYFCYADFTSSHVQKKTTNFMLPSPQRRYCPDSISCRSAAKMLHSDGLTAAPYEWNVECKRISTQKLFKKKAIESPNNLCQSRKNALFPKLKLPTERLQESGQRFHFSFCIFFLPYCEEGFRPSPESCKAGALHVLKTLNKIGKKNTQICQFSSIIRFHRGDAMSLLFCTIFVDFGGTLHITHTLAQFCHIASCDTPCSNPTMTVNIFRNSPKIPRNDCKTGKLPKKMTEKWSK